MLARRSTIAACLLALFLPGCTADGDDGDGSDGGVTDGSHSGHDGHTGHDDGHSGDDGQSSGGGSGGSDGDDATTGGGGGTDATGTSGTPRDTWENWAYPDFFTAYCTDCHPGQSSRDFHDYDTVVANTEHIRCGVAPEVISGCDGHIEPGHLPIGNGPKPSEDERWRLVAWVDDGMPRD